MTRQYLDSLLDNVPDNSYVSEPYIVQIVEIRCITDIIHNKPYGCGNVTKVIGHMDYICCPVCGNGIVEVECV